MEKRTQEYPLISEHEVPFQEPPNPKPLQQTEIKRLFAPDNFR